MPTTVHIPDPSLKSVDRETSAAADVAIPVPVAAEIAFRVERRLARRMPS
jgi:hypothetical protein